ncbi:MFS transporter [Paraburkholderia bonniea]|uniref:MFS transporter n=1 Tax=Paraburkholderia bonniea TaxID=2152891 RepID=UPI001290D97A|nr:MFS transporter [Paraburkholderia bonniea]WJF90034.1 MFS transporter [Paraburkholderia bonniea]WJF93348.1 MFS transporter [Paraburkholderia bonniea]
MSGVRAAPQPHLSGPGKLPGATYVLTLCQAINLTAAVVSVTIAALVGSKLAPGHAWATVPYGVQFAAVALSTYPAASFMRRYGRKKGFLLGALFLIAAGGLGYHAVVQASFTQLIVAHGLLGMYVAFANFYRFAAVDALAPEMRPKGVSLVVAGGIVAAVSGPLLSMGLKDVGDFSPFSLCYASFVLLGLATAALMMFWRPAAAAAPVARSIQTRAVSSRPAIIAAIVAAALSYLIMNMLMVQASLLMDSMCVSFDTSSFAIQGHVIAMFAPSFVTGAILARIGYRNTLFAGYLLLAGSTVLGIMGFSLGAMVAGLLMLGIGWNFGYVGGGALLASVLTEDNRHRMQGINDSIIAICATAGAFLPAVLQTAIGWQNTNLLCLVLCLAAAGLTWACMREAKTPAAEVLRS